MAISKLASDINLANLDCTSLKGVGPKLAEKLERLHIHNVLDLLLHLPYRYEDRTQVKSIASLQDGDRAMLKVQVEMTQVKYGKRRSLVCRAADNTASIEFRFFYFNKSQQSRLEKGAEFYAFGEVRRYGYQCSMVHPELTPVDSNNAAPLLDSLTPVYPTTDGLHQNNLRQLTRQAVDLLEKHPIDNLLPEKIQQQFGLPDINSALSWIHTPPKNAKPESLHQFSSPSAKRLICEELIAHQLSMILQRNKHQQQTAMRMDSKGALQQQLLNQLPFKLTKAQQRVSAEIITDLKSDKPMLRLLQGDVGAGKTLVAAMAALQAIEAGFQVAIMAPTEILAEQHYASFYNWMTKLGVKTTFLISKLPAKDKKLALDDIASGQTQLIIGTHALFQKEVFYQKLGFIIIDEQHRFGVNQRLALKQKAPDGLQLHQLMMTATPIPRTLSMTVYADMDLSIIDELPPGRTPVMTVALPEERRPHLIERIRNACQDEQRQVYWVCTLIDESEEVQCQAAETTANQLAEQLPNLSVGLVHGRLKSEQKQLVMDKFKQGELDILVATTVIEVGVDVPNASLMVIENPERLGLSQLHQLRGRVGRGSKKSHCVLLYKPPLSVNAQNRLQVMRDTNDGFVLADEDLKLRGPGELLGTRQTGDVGLRFADLVRDAELVEELQQVAKFLATDSPDIAQKISQRWLGSRQDFADV
ncbi:ATP-dependent DNA helicase RecG [Kangiella geojedonensis]|uniref:ATP-dependent DNA helicase RecG n=1 Tax=Kangiella geojedonensis TaxID=914150 RepID=A0A0F6RB07_9GAMM|nr:ATP-dependent DNA helicase RecG [Kangiella geojedonensis]AKE51143.1 ATP-dependent DNA helicase RecG [Kangiella geojedonensis]